jgi:hypothetical protein
VQLDAVEGSATNTEGQSVLFSVNIAHANTRLHRNLTSGRKHEVLRTVIRLCIFRA